MVKRGGKQQRTHKPRQGPSRLAKIALVERMKHDTADVLSGSLVPTLRKQGYEELPLDEIHDRLAKVQMALADFILTKRGS